MVKNKTILGVLTLLLGLALTASAENYPYRIGSIRQGRKLP